jgi:hypothetical protein
MIDDSQIENKTELERLLRLAVPALRQGSDPEWQLLQSQLTSQHTEALLDLIVEFWSKRVNPATEDGFDLGLLQVALQLGSLWRKATVGCLDCIQQGHIIERDAIGCISEVRLAIIALPTAANSSSPLNSFSSPSSSSRNNEQKRTRTTTCSESNNSNNSSSNSNSSNNKSKSKNSTNKNTNLTIEEAVKEALNFLFELGETCLAPLFADQLLDGDSSATAAIQKLSMCLELVPVIMDSISAIRINNPSLPIDESSLDVIGKLVTAVSEKSTFHVVAILL